MCHTLTLLLALTTCLSAAESTAARIDTRIAAFESTVDRSFVPVQKNLEGWRERQQRAATRELQDLLKKAGPEDQVYLAYHLLSHDPRYRPARDIFTKIGIPAPYDEQGAPTPGWTTPTCTNRQLVETVSSLTYPPFEAVAEAINLKNSAAASYWKKLGNELSNVKKDLVAIAVEKAAENAADTVYPLLAYYHPEAREVALYYKAMGKPVPRQRVWFNPVDRWLLDNELAGLDGLVGPDGKPLSGGPNGTHISNRAWDFPEFLRGARLELVGTANLPLTIRFTDLRGKGAEIEVGTANVVLRAVNDKNPLATLPLDVDLSRTPLPLQVEVRGKTIAVSVGGIRVGSANMPNETAYRRCHLSGSVQASSLRIRYLSATSEAELLGLDPAAPVAAVTPTPAEAPAWKAQRDSQLATPLTVAFADTSLEEVAAMLGVLSGVDIRLDPSAEPLKDLPVTLSTDSLPLGKTLEWLQRLTDVAAEADDKGLRLVWRP